MIPLLRASREELFQFEADWVMDNRRFHKRLGEGETPVDEAIDATVAWYQQRT